MKTFVIPFNVDWLNIGSSFASLRLDMYEWLLVHCNNKWNIKYDSNHSTYVLIFDNDDDYTLFLLRWC